MSMSVSARRIPFVAATMVLILGIMATVFPSRAAFATTETLTNRSLTISSSDPTASQHTTSYSFTFSVASGTDIKSVGIQICTTADGTCTAPTGFDSEFAGLNGQPVGLGDTSGWTIQAHGSQSNLLDISDSGSGAAPGANSTINFNNVQNPTTANQTFFAWITTYSTSTYTTVLDYGVTAASTTNLIVLSGTMPESLVFCTGSTVQNANCTGTIGSGTVSFNQDFSPSSTSFATSQFAASTNALHGYSITVSGPTLSSGGGSYQVTAIGTVPAVSTPGTKQFGMNLAANTGVHSGDPDIATYTVNSVTYPASSYESPLANNGDYMGSATANFVIGDPSWANAAQQSKFLFDPTSANVIAKSDDSIQGGSTAKPTDGQIFTASYIANVSANLPAGTYTTTLTYICTPEF